MFRSRETDGNSRRLSQGAGLVVNSIECAQILWIAIGGVNEHWNLWAVFLFSARSQDRTHSIEWQEHLWSYGDCGQTLQVDRLL